MYTYVCTWCIRTCVCMCTCVYISVCTSVHVCGVCMRVCVYVCYLCVYGGCVFTCMCMYMHMCVHAYVCMCVHAYVWVCTYIWVCTCICVRVCVCTEQLTAETPFSSFPTREKIKWTTMSVLGPRSFFFFKINLFTYLFLATSGLVATCGFSLVAASGGYSSLRCEGFSLRWLLLLWITDYRRKGFSSCGTWAYLLRGMWNLPRPGLKPMSPALAGGFCFFFFF